jgi:hypothetical protein
VRQLPPDPSTTHLVGGFRPFGVFIARRGAAFCLSGPESRVGFSGSGFPFSSAALLPQRAQFRCRHSLHHELVERAAREFGHRCSRSLAQCLHRSPSDGINAKCHATHAWHHVALPSAFGRQYPPVPTVAAMANELRGPYVLGLHSAVTCWRMCRIYITPGGGHQPPYQSHRRLRRGMSSASAIRTRVRIETFSVPCSTRERY